MGALNRNVQRHRPRTRQLRRLGSNQPRAQLPPAAQRQARTQGSLANVILCMSHKPEIARLWLMKSPATLLEARIQRLAKMNLWIRAKPEMARTWFLRMNQTNRDNPQVLKILSALATLNDLEVPALTGA